MQIEARAEGDGIIGDMFLEVRQGGNFGEIPYDELVKIANTMGEIELGDEESTFDETDEITD